MSMNTSNLLFLAADVMDQMKPSVTEKTIIPGIGDVFLVVAVCAAIGIGVMIWAVFLRGGSNSREKLRTSNSSSASRKRKRKQRYTNRNPTLAETGGLPPIREEGPGNKPPV
jgi:hypothetical protein